MKLSEAISKRVKEILEQKNLSQYYIFKNGGVPRSTICDVVNNNKKRVSTYTVYQICATLGISLKDFFNSPYFNNLDD